MKTKFLVIGALLSLLPVGAWAQPRFSLPASVMAGVPGSPPDPGAPVLPPIDWPTDRPMPIGAVAVDGNRILVRQSHERALFSQYLEIVAGGDGRFSLATPTTDPGPSAAWGGPTALGDVDGDGAVDRLVVQNRPGHTVTLELGDGAGGFGAATEIMVGKGPVSVVIADIDGDGRADLVTGNRTAGTVAIVRQLAPGDTSLDAEIAAAEGRLAQARARVASLTETRDGLHATQQELAADLQEVNAQIGQGETAIHAAEANVDGLQTEIAALAATVAQLQQQLADETRALDELPATMAALESGNAARRADITSARTAQAALETQIAALETEARRLTRQNGRQASSNAGLQQRVNQVEAVNAKLAAALSEVRARIAAATAEHGVVVQQTAQTQAETRRQRDVVDQLEAQRRERDRIDQQEAQRRERERVDQLEAQRRERERVDQLEAQRRERERVDQLEAQRRERERAARPK